MSTELEDRHVRIAEPSRVVRLVLERNEEGLTITLRLIATKDSAVTELRFLGASDVRFRSETTDLLGIELLLAEDISSRGWEGTRFHVKDVEEEFMSFYCRAIERTLGECPADRAR